MKQVLVRKRELFPSFPTNCKPPVNQVLFPTRQWEQFCPE